MKFRAGFLKVACACVVILMQSLDAGLVPRKRVGGVSCKLKELAALTKRLMGDSLMCFDSANGKHLGTWYPGFPELKVQKNSPLHGSSVQCCLLLMAEGLEQVLEDQRNNLNPEDVSLQRKLSDTISRVKMLTACVKGMLGGECFPKPSMAAMPKHAFERKQWSHTLLKMAEDYLDWLEHKFEVHDSKFHLKIKHNGSELALQRYLEGSG